MRQTIGAPETTPTRNHHRVIVAARRPRPAAAYPAAPAAPGTLRPGAANAGAKIAGRPSGATQATIEAGPACCAARPGRSRRPGPNRAPMYGALARGTDSGRVRAGEVLIQQSSAETVRTRWQRLRCRAVLAQHYAAI